MLWIAVMTKRLIRGVHTFSANDTVYRVVSLLVELKFTSRLSVPLRQGNFNLLISACMVHFALPTATLCGLPDIVLC